MLLSFAWIHAELRDRASSGGGTGGTLSRSVGAPLEPQSPYWKASVSLLSAKHGLNKSYHETLILVMTEGSNEQSTCVQWPQNTVMNETNTGTTWRMNRTDGWWHLPWCLWGHWPHPLKVLLLRPKKNKSKQLKVRTTQLHVACCVHVMMTFDITWPCSLIPIFQNLPMNWGFLHQKL